MFTGLIEELGTVSSIDHHGQGSTLSISAALVTSDLKNGDSVAVDGVCLTALNVRNDGFSADVSPETLQRTTIKDLRSGSVVNLERSVTPATRLGGHIVQGHVDCRGSFLSAAEDGDFRTVTIGFPPEFARYLVHKGSVAVDGISLTVAALREGSFDVAVIPKTWQTTNLSALSPGGEVNLEADIIAKYVQRMMEFRT